jgi:hypothetical protein
MADDSKPYITRPNHDEALKAQINAEAPEAALRVNPNPVGSVVKDDGGEPVGVYVGTDPIYQNSSTVANQPFVSDDEESADSLGEERLAEMHDLSDVDESELAADYGTGGVALKSTAPVSETFRTILPGQEGYDRAKAEEQQGPPLRVFSGDAPASAKSDDDADKDEDEGIKEASDEGTNFASTVEPPLPPETPSDAGDAAGDKPAKKAQAKPEKSS